MNANANKMAPESQTSHRECAEGRCRGAEMFVMFHGVPEFFDPFNWLRWFAEKETGRILLQFGEHVIHVMDGLLGIRKSLVQRVKIDPGHTRLHSGNDVLQLANQAVQIVSQSLQLYFLNRVVRVLEEGFQFGVAAPQISHQRIGIGAETDRNRIAPRCPRPAGRFHIVQRSWFMALKSRLSTLCRVFSTEASNSPNSPGADGM